MLRYAYDTVFTKTNSCAGFRRAGIHLIDPTRHLFLPRPVSSDNFNETMSVADLEILFQPKGASKDNEVIGCETFVIKTGFVHTTHGAVLTSDRALKLVRQKHHMNEAKAIAKALQLCESERKMASCNAKKNEEARRMRELAWERRAALCGLSVVAFKSSVRSLAELRAIARHRMPMKRGKHCREALHLDIVTVF